MHFRLSAFAAALAFVVGLAGTATAQVPYDRVISFGDSLTDNGNLAGLGAAPPPPYFNGRFSNGPTWAEIIAGMIRPQAGPNGTMNNFGPVVPGTNTNFAFGGARADNNLNLLNPAIPSLNQQIGAFAGLFGGTVQPNNLVTIWAGANDIFQQLPLSGGSTVYMQNVVNGSTLAIAQAIQTLGGLGARTILINNLPNFAFAPNFLGTPGAPLAGFSTLAFNQALAAQMALVKAANPGMNIIQTNTAGLFDAVIANPGAFGFANVTQQCLTTPTCVGGTNAVRDTFLFWDGVHPTAAGHRLVAAMAMKYLMYGVDSAAAYSLAEIAVGARQATIMRVFDRIAMGRMVGGPTETGQWSMDVWGEQQNSSNGGNRVGYSTQTAGFAATYSRIAMPGLGLGLAVGVQTGNARQGAITFNPTQLNADFWAQYRAGMFFANATIGGQFDVTDSWQRQVGIGNLFNTAGVVRGSTFSGALEAGIAHAIGTVTLVPSARLAFLSSTVATFNETGIVAPLVYNGRGVTAVTGAAELRAETMFTSQFGGFARVGYEGFLSYHGNSVTGNLFNNTTNAVTNIIADPRSAGFYAGLGITGKVNEQVTVGLDYRGTFGMNRQRLTASVRWSF